MKLSNRLVISVFLCFGLWSSAQAVLEIKITQGAERALPITLAPFVWQPAADAAKLPTDVVQIVVMDLARSGEFNPERAKQAQDLPPDEQQRKALLATGNQYMVVGRVRQQAPDLYLVQFQLFDVVRGQQILGYSLPSRGSQLRQVAHRVSDLIYEELTGKPGAFSTKVAYVTTQGRGKSRQFILQISDADGFNPQTIFTSSKPLMSPSWSPDGEKLAYVSFHSNQSGVYVQEVYSGKVEKIASHPGINGAPAWSPDGNKLALVLSQQDSPEIYVYDLNDKQLTRLTKNRVIDTEPAWFPDGQRLAFTSDRSGSPQIYTVSVNGGKAQRLSFQGDYNAGADISPDGKKMVMVQGQQGRFRIAIQDLERGYTRLLTKGKLDESPSFAPNGSMIIYATEAAGRGVLAAVSEDGQVHQELRLQEGEVREPAWSPLID